MKPNILIVFVDELRQDALGVYGNRDIIAPNLEAFAKCSTTYNNHFCAYPVCTPSRYSFLSGLYANQHSVCTNKGTLSPDINTFPRILRDNGYRTSAIGKMHASPTYLDVGYEKMLLSEQDGDGRFEDDYHKELYDNGLWDSQDAIDQRSEYRKDASGEYFSSFGTYTTDLPEEYHSTSWVTRKALEEMNNWKEEGNMLFVSYIKPHHPFDPPKRLVDLYKETDIDLMAGYTSQVPPYDYDYDKGYFDNSTLSEEVLKKMTLYYYANISHIDEGFGQMCNLLKQKGLYDNTIIIFTSDHGDYMGFHHMALKQNHMYDPLMKIPLLIKNTAQKEPIQENALSDNTQMAAEILRKAGISPSPEMNDFPIDRERSHLFGIYRNPKGFSYMVRSRKYKLLTSYDGSEILLDLEKDPLELSHIDDRKDIICEMRKHLFDQLLFHHPFRNFYDKEAPVISKGRKDSERQVSNLKEYSDKMTRKFLEEN